MSQIFSRLVSSLLICLSIVLAGKIVERRILEVEERTWQNVDMRVMGLIQTEAQLLGSILNAVIQYDLDRDDVMRAYRLKKAQSSSEKPGA